MPELPELFTAPDDLTLVSDADLSRLETEGVAEFDRIHAIPDVTPENLTYAIQLRDDLDRVKSELAARTVRAETAATLAKAKAERAMAELQTAVHGPAEGTPEAAAAATQDLQTRDEAIAASATRGAMTAIFQVMGERSGGLDLTQATERAVASLGATARVAPKPQVPAARLSITASGSGQELPSLDALTQEFISRAQSIPITRSGRDAARHQVARVNNTFAHTVDERTNPAVVQELWRSMVNGDTQEALVAGGGWCAPSEVMYNFFNIAEFDGGIDLPTVGVTRGGIKYPVSPAIGDVFFQNVGSNPASGFGGFAFPFSNASDPWLWTESDDILTVTGSVNKPTLRVPCASFNETRLEAYGLTVTAGNLTDNAWPEATRNFIQLLRAAYQHAINARLIGLMVTASGGANTIGAVTTDGPAPRIYNAVAMAATDYRARYAMNTNAVLEVILPYWIKEVLRADLALKNFVDEQAVTDAELESFFTVRKVRPQWVNDWQVRGASQPGSSTVQLVWPATVNFMLYAAGTFLHGTGMTLDLGVVRDSLLNSENDFTAAWAEEAHLVAQVGHASRLYTVAFNVSGQSGGAVATPNGAHV